MWPLLLALISQGEAETCVHKKTTYYSDEVPPVAVSYMKNAGQCQEACENHALCKVWTFLSDAGSCWQLPESPQLLLIGNEHGISGKKDCRPEGTAAQNTTWLRGAPVANVPLSPGGKRPACSSKGKAYDDPKVQVLNGGYVTEATDCEQACAAAPLCFYWTYYNDTGGCWLQGRQATVYFKDNAISGPKLCAAPLKSSRYDAGHNITSSGQMVMMRSINRPNCSFRGKALREAGLKAPNAYLESAEKCQSLCATTASCTFFTYYIDSKGCWLQTSNVTSFESEMAISGPKRCGVAVDEAVDEPVDEPMRELQAKTLFGRAIVTMHRHGTAVGVLLALVCCSLALLLLASRQASLSYRRASTDDMEDFEKGLTQA